MDGHRRDWQTRLHPLPRLLLGAGLALGLAGAALAAPPGGMGGHGKGMHGATGHHGGYRGGHHGLRPHNAAAHFLRMANRLGLDKGQVQRLRELRDRYIEEHAVTEARLRAAQQDLQALLRADTIDKDKAGELLGRIGQLEGQLWQAFIDQLATIKELLTPEQRQRLRMMHRRMGHGTGSGMPAGHPKGGMKGHQGGGT